MLKDSIERIFLILEGNMGSGKSTLLRLIKENIPGVNIVYEPTDRWQRVGKEGNILDLFYKDTKRWAYTFQSYAFITRIQSIIEQAKKDVPITISERSVFCDRYCFAKNCFESGNMTQLEWNMYKELFSWLVENYAQKPNGFIYLQAAPEVCKERVKKRNRAEEEGVPLSYLKTLHSKHEDWLVCKKDVDAGTANIPVLTLNCDSDFENDLQQKHKHIESISNFIKEIELKKVNSHKFEKQLQV